jgi:nitroreductase
MTQPTAIQTLSDALRWRYATKKFDSNRRIPADQWSALEEAMVLAPSSFGLQPWRFIVVETPEIRAQLPAFSWGQSQPVDCSHYVVFAQRKGLSVADVDHFIDRMVEVRGVTRESLEGYKGFILNFYKAATEQGWLEAWCSRQVYIALGQAMAAAALLGIDTCALEGIEPAKYDALLGLEAQGYTSLCGLAFGYRAEDDKYARTPKVRFPLSEVVKHV